MGMELWSRTEEHRLVDLWEDGLSVAKIAKIMGRSRSAVNTRMRLLGVRRDPAAPRRPNTIRDSAECIEWTREMDRQMLALRAKGRSMAAIAVEMGQREQAVRERLYDLDPRPIRWSGRSDSSICWYCARAVGADQCCWAARFEPVPGWDARRRDKEGGESYFVYDCPQFEEG